MREFKASTALNTERVQKRTIEKRIWEIRRKQVVVSKMQRLDGMVMMNDGLFEGENLRQLDECMWLALRELRSNVDFI